MPLFGGRRAVWVKAGGRNIAPAVEALLGAEASPNAASSSRPAICAATRRCARCASAPRMPRRCRATPMSERDRERLIDDEMRAAGLTACARRTRAVDPVARRRPRCLAQRNPQADALRARPRRGQRRGRHRGGVRRFGARRLRTSSMRPLPAGRPNSKLSSPRRAPPAPRPDRSCSTPSARSRNCTNGAARSRPARRSRSMPCSRPCISAARRSSKRR